MVDLPQPTLLDYALVLCVFLLTALPYLNSLEGNMVRVRPLVHTRCWLHGHSSIPHWPLLSPYPNFYLLWSCCAGSAMMCVPFPALSTEAH